MLALCHVTMLPYSAVILAKKGGKMESRALELHVQAVRLRIKAACERASRPLDSVRLLPVSKTVDTDTLRLAYALGLQQLGENRVQEMRRKAQDMADLPGLSWVLIGHLQSNKVRDALRHAVEFQALDSLALAEALDRRLQTEGRALDVLVQVNTSGEASKYGLAPQDVAGFLPKLQAFSSLRVRGLMTLAVFSAEAPRVRACFVRLRQLQQRLRDDLPQGMTLDELSMGMSGDFEMAIEEGATCVRVGQAIFGARRLPDEFFWPSEGERT